MRQNFCTAAGTASRVATLNVNPKEYTITASGQHVGGGAAMRVQAERNQRLDFGPRALQCAAHPG
jgi:hypothetical protein